MSDTLFDFDHEVDKKALTSLTGDQIKVGEISQGNDWVLLGDNMIFSPKNMWLSIYDVDTGELKTLVSVIHDKKDSRTPDFA